MLCRIFFSVRRHEIFYEDIFVNEWIISISKMYFCWRYDDDRFDYYYKNRIEIARTQRIAIIHKSRYFLSLELSPNFK